MAELKNVAPLADFDWNAYESGDTLVNESREAQEKAYEGSLNKVNDHEVVDGTVIAMNKREVVVNIGFKSDGIIPMSEFRYNPDLKVGGLHREPRGQERTAHPFSQEGTRYPFLGSCERSPRK